MGGFSGVLAGGAGALACSLAGCVRPGFCDACDDVAGDDLSGFGPVMLAYPLSTRYSP
jgi:hypothetical protein